MGNTISTGGGSNQPVVNPEAGNNVAALARSHRNQRLSAASSPSASQVPTSRVFSDAASAARGEVQLARGDESVTVAKTPDANRLPATFVISKVWEDPSLIAPNVDHVKSGKLPDDLKGGGSGVSSDTHNAERFALQVAGLHPALGLNVGISDKMEVDGIARPKTGKTVVEIPTDKLEAAFLAAGSVASDGRIEVSEAPGAYKVLTGKDADQVRSLPSLIIGFRPSEGTDWNDIDAVGKRISTVLRQESTLTSLKDSKEGSALNAQLPLDRNRDKSGDDAILQALTQEFGGATKTGPNQISSIVSFDIRGQDAAEERASVEQRLQETIGHIPAVGNADFVETKTGFSEGVRIQSKSANKAAYLDALAAEMPGLKDSMKRRAEDNFDRTWDQLFSKGMRPAEDNYVIIDERMRIGPIGTENEEEAPMHWGARLVSLNEDKTGIQDLWSSELVLHKGNTVGGDRGDPVIGLEDPARDNTDKLTVRETASGREEVDYARDQPPIGWKPETKLIKDQGLTSASYFNTGSYTIPVSDVSGPIQSAKELSHASARTDVNDMYTNDTNCLVYVTGLAKEAGPTNERISNMLDAAFAPEVMGGGSAPHLAAPVSVHGMGYTDQLPNPTIGLSTGDSGYVNAVSFLQGISDETFSGPIEKDVKSLAQKFHKLPQGTEPTRDQMASAREYVTDWFNKGMTYELAQAPAAEQTDARQEASDDQKVDHNARTSMQDLRSSVFGKQIKTDHVSSIERRKSLP